MGEERAHRVLIVDDHAWMRAALRAFLERDGLVVVGEAADGLEALELVDALRPDAVTMDLEMPRLDGLSTTRILTELEDPPPVVVVSGSTSDDVAERALDAGACAFVEKARAENSLVETLLGVLAPVST